MFYLYHNFVVVVLDELFGFFKLFACVTNQITLYAVNQLCLDNEQQRLIC